VSGYELGAEIAGGKGGLTVRSVSQTFSRYEITAKQDQLRGTRGDDFINASAGDDTVSGFGGDDILTGGKGSDTITGGPGSDVLTGGPGRDRLDGGGGSDRFDFDSIADSKVGADRDTVTFLRSQGDRIDLSAIDADTRGAPGDQAFAWVNASDLDARFTKEGGQLRFAGGVLMGDVTGDGKADFHIKLVGALAASDVIL
jgi:Ca2+-binding RTX toxin-like protein